MVNRRYTYSLRFDETGGCWEIKDMQGRGYALYDDQVVWSMPHLPEHDGLGEPPLAFRRKFEALLRESGWTLNSEEPVNNIVEMMADEDECAWDQPCAFGYRVEDHAVYCHNEAWLYSPRKCRRHTGPSEWGGEPWPHCECPGYLANPLYKNSDN
ncbi:MAG: hypothetical protein ACRYGG_19715 [Janthinobacterium lividum]